MQKKWLIFINLLFVFFAKAQTPSIVWGSEINTPSRSEIKTIYRNNQNQIYILRKCYRTLFRAEKWQLDKLSANDLKWQQTKEIKSFFNDPKIKSETTIGLENQLIVGGIKTQLNNSEFVLKKISEEFTNSVVIADTLISEEFKQRYIVSNIDQSQLLHVVVGQQKTNLYVKIKSFDTSLSIIKSGKFNLEIPQKNSEILSVISPENDLVYFLIRHSPKSESIFSYDIYKYSLVACDLNSHQYKEFEITLPEKNITDIGIKQNLNGSLIISGFYSNKTTTRDDVAGVFYLSISNKTLSINGKGIKELPPELLRQFMSERKVRKGKELSGFTINHIVTNSDGGIIILAEQNYMSQVCNTDFRTGIVYCNDYYYYNDIIAIRINPQGEIDWTSRIGKRQVTINDGGYYSSYFPFIVNEGVYLIFNDTPKNVGARPFDSYTMSNVRRSVPVKVLLKNSGEVQREEVLEYTKQNFILRPKAYFLLLSGEGIITGNKRGNDIVGKIFINTNKP